MDVGSHQRADPPLERRPLHRRDRQDARHLEERGRRQGAPAPPLLAAVADPADVAARGPAGPAARAAPGPDRVRAAPPALVTRARTRPAPAGRDPRARILEPELHVAGRPSRRARLPLLRRPRADGKAL